MDVIKADNGIYCEGYNYDKFKVKYFKKKELTCDTNFVSSVDKIAGILRTNYKKGKTMLCRFPGKNNTVVVHDDINFLINCIYRRLNDENWHLVDRETEERGKGPGFVYVFEFMEFNSRKEAYKYLYEK